MIKNVVLLVAKLSNYMDLRLISNKINRIALAVSILLCLNKTILAQHPASHQLNTEKGAPSNEIYRVIQDDFGYIWIGCDAGLFKYDGINYKKFSHSDQNGRGISFLQIDKKQRIWCKNFFGQIYRTDNDSLKIVKSISTSNPAYPQFTFDDKSNFWYYDKRELIQCNENGTEIQKIACKELLPNESITSLKFFKDQIYYITNKLSLYRYDSKNRESVKISSNISLTALSNSAAFIEHKDTLFLFVEFENVAQKYSLYHITNDQVKIYHKLEEYTSNKRIYSVYSDNVDLWLTTSEGVEKIDSPKLTHKLFKNEKISYMLRDREGQYWFSTLHNGLYVIPNLEIVSLNSTNSELSDNNINLVKAIRDNKLLLGSYSGKIYEYDTQNKLVEEKYNVKEEFILNVKAIENDNRYTIVSRGRLCLIDHLTGHQYFPKLSNVRDIAISEDSVFLVFPNMILSCKINDLLTNEGPKYLKIKNEGGKSIAYDSIHKTLYISMGNGLIFRDKYGKWNNIELNQKKVFAGQIRYRNGILWVATVSNGIIGIQENLIKHHFNSSNLLKDNNIRTLGISDNYLWVCSEQYLHRINLTSLETGVFDMSNQISPKDINSIETHNQIVYLGTNNGVEFFPENLNWKNETRPNIRFTSIFDEKLSLDYDNNNVTIEFSSTSFKSRGTFYYKYKLIGLDTSFTKISGNTPYIHFSRIPPGKFNLQVIGVNEHGIESAPINLAISVSTPFWQKWWFYLLTGLLFSVVVTIFFSTRIKFIRKKAEQKNQMVSSQLTALKAQMNPHFMFNTLNSIQDLILKKDIKNTNYYLSKYGMLMRKILEISEKNEILLSEEIEILDNYLQLEKLRFGDDFEFHILKHEQVKADHVYVPPMVIQPFIENAIKHGLLHKKGLKTLKIEFKTNETELICTIEDNGIGRKRSAEINKKYRTGHYSFATNATEKRIELLNSFSKKQYRFEIIDKEEKGEPTGTKVNIHIPNIIS
ncbi:MAG: histidine kinase [Bacteroidetes bacterium]|nr:histidine kinase [Bacteroidota bacterium]